MTPERVLIDSSVWIEVLREKGSLKYREKVNELLADNHIAICGVIIVELLGGVRSKSEYAEFKQELDSLHYLETTKNNYFYAAEISYSLRNKGFKIPATDALIAAVAIENKCRLFHKDKHFDIIAKYSNLKIQGIR